MIQFEEGEILKEIEGYNGIYKISNYGRVLSFSRREPFVLKTNVFKFSVQVPLHKNKSPHYYNLGKLVAKYFVDNPYDYDFILHLDGDITNNRYDNLQWVATNPYAGMRSTKNFYNIFIKKSQYYEVLLYCSTHDINIKNIKFIDIKTLSNRFPNYDWIMQYYLKTLQERKPFNLISIKDEIQIPNYNKYKNKEVKR